ncbi:MAG: hypothetical protein HC876_03745 [Chloroflexaceae bacterium]|nr:hypothetical protein [Chloroflexaceae bacterium]
MVLLVDLPQREAGRWRWLAGATVLLACLMLTRYVGVFVYAAVGLWWAWRSGQRRWRLLMREYAVLALAALPLAAWLAYTITQRRSLGEHLSSPDNSFIEGLLALLRESTQLVLPVLTLGEVQILFGWAGWLLYAAIVGGAVLLLWRFRTGRLWTGTPPRTPLLLFVLLYALLYTVVQPFMSFWPMDMRDIMAVLCLLVPWLFARFSYLPPRWSYSFLAGYVALNAALILGPVAVRGLPDWFALLPPQVAAVTSAEKGADAPGLLRWMQVTPINAADLERYHPEVLERLQARQPSDGAPVVVLTNLREVFAAYPFTAPESVYDWLQAGPCVSQHSVVIVVFVWDQWATAAAELPPQIEQRCPNLEPVPFAYGVLYEVPQIRLGEGR